MTPPPTTTAAAAGRLARAAAAIFALAAVGTANAQSGKAIGSWRSHFPYHRVTHVEMADRNTLLGASHSGYFVYNALDYTLERHNVMSGLSDIGITAFKYHPRRRTLLVGYQSGNIDLVRDGQVTNLNDIARAGVMGDKSIGEFKIYGDTVYVVTSFGVNVLNLATRSIVSTYRFSDAGRPVTVNDVAALGDSVYVATSAGVYHAPRRGVNLLDYNNWSRLRSVPAATQAWTVCEAWADSLWLGRALPDYQDDQLLVYRQGAWRALPFIPNGGDLRRVKNDGAYLYVTTNNRVYWFNPDGTQAHSTPYYGPTLQGARDMAAIDSWRYFVADDRRGIVAKIKYDTTETVLAPNGPGNYKCYHANTAGDEVWISGGGPGEPWSHHGIYRFSGGQWRTWNKYTTDSLAQVPNLSISATDPRDPGHVVAGSFGYGMVEFRGGEVSRVWHPGNSALGNVAGYGEGYCRVNGLAFDKAGNLWVAQWGAPRPLAVLTADGQWRSFDLGGLIPGAMAGRMEAMPWGHIWMLMEEAGVAVFDPAALLAGQPGAYNTFAVRRSDGTAFGNVQALCVDTDQTVWIGMKTGGLFVYYNPRQALEQDPVASQLLVDDNGLTQYLMGSQNITDIKVDGGNRKWVTTYGGGAFLLSPGGNKQILNLTQATSPMISDNVFSAAIDNATGELFFATDQGVVSFVGSATQGNATLEELVIYPNPIPPGFSGPVIIKGLMEDTTIKITNLAGELVYECYSNGGTGIWNARDFAGERVAPGVYLVFCATPDGKHSASGRVYVRGGGR